MEPLEGLSVGGRPYTDEYAIEKRPEWFDLRVWAQALRERGMGVDMPR